MVKCPRCHEENPPKFRLCGYCGTPLQAEGVTAAEPRPREVRRTVTVVFCDLKDSTSLGERLDPEVVHEVLDRYFAAMTREIAGHGGKVDKYIGDAIMAVFGLPVQHEDDALRAVRAAVAMQSALRAVNSQLSETYGLELVNRTGVNTGAIVAIDDPGSDQMLATGDTVNVAARLEQAAPANEIYIGDTTWRLVRDAVKVEAVQPLKVKGKREHVAAYRLLSVIGHDGTARRHDMPFVGRDAELMAIDRVLHEVLDTRSARLVTLIGDAGIGKSRLAQEVIARAGKSARVVRGRCLAYGDGITFWPLRGMVNEAAGIIDDDPTELAFAKIERVVNDNDVVQRLASAMNLSNQPFPLHEIAWATRKFLGRLAKGTSVVALVDDIHWAEAAFLELIETVLRRDSGAILILCTARHELLDRKTDWGEGERMFRLVLRPLSDDASAAVAREVLGQSALPDIVVKRIVEAAEGNPLYVEQMLSALVETRLLELRGGRWMLTREQAELDVPPTITALLESRVVQLPVEERTTIEPASVVGVEFPVQAVASMMPGTVRTNVEQHLVSLTRKQLVTAVPQRDEHLTYRFHHHLVRDAIYNGLLKRRRAMLHVDFVRWADRVNAERGRGLEFEEILGYHLEQAYRYMRELGSPNETEMAIGIDAARRLSAAGGRASRRGDYPAAANLYRRAVALLDRDDPARLALLPELGEVLLEVAAFSEAHTVLAEAEETAEKAGNGRIAASARILRMRVRLFNAEPGASSDEALRVANEAIPLLEAEGAHRELARAWRMIGMIHGSSARYELANDAVTRSTTYHQLGGEGHRVTRNTVGLASGALLGPMPVPQAIDLCERLFGQAVGDRLAEGKVLCTLAQLRAMNGEFDKARDCYRRGRALLHELGSSLSVAATGCDVLCAELVASERVVDLTAALGEAMPDFEFLKRSGETYYMSTIAALISRVLRDTGRDDDAMTFSRIAEDASAVDDVESQASWRSIRAPILARAGQMPEAESLARSAVALAQTTDALVMHADTARELATVLRLAGQSEEARRTIDAAIAIYMAKGDVVSAARSRVWRDQLGTP